MLANNIALLTAALVALAEYSNAAPLSEHLQKRLSGQTLRPSTAPNLCLNGWGSDRLVDCNTKTETFDGPYAQWTVNPGQSSSVCLDVYPPKSYGSCLSAGPDFIDGQVRPIATANGISGVVNDWYYTDDNHLAVTGGNACLSYSNGAVTTQACGTLGVDQVWNLVPYGSAGQPPAGNGGKRIRWSGNGVSGCLTVMGADLQNFGRIAIAECMADDNRYAWLQKFDYTRGSTKIKVAANPYFVKEYCLDLGVVRRQDATNLHLYECVDVPQQQFWITDAGDDHIALEGVNQCIDVKADSGFAQDSSYSSLGDVQSWQCFGGNGNQMFSFDL